MSCSLKKNFRFSPYDLLGLARAKVMVKRDRLANGKCTPQWKGKNCLNSMMKPMHVSASPSNQVSVHLGERSREGHNGSLA